MYFPYLYGRRFELLALRSAHGELGISETIVPIVEPVRRNPGDLKQCLRDLGAGDVRTIVVLNPNQGDFASENARPFQRAVREEFDHYESLVPGFTCDQRSGLQEAISFIEEHRGRDVALLYHGSHLRPADITRLRAIDSVRFHISVRDSMAAEQRSLLPRGKAVDVRDRFNIRARNADYAGREFFSDSHQDFRANAVGFGDYSVIGYVYRGSGGPAHAVAIHGIFKEAETGQLWVEHFVSDDVDPDVGTVERKYLQAAAKLVRASTRRRNEFGQDAALAAYASDVSEHYYPGLGVNKQRMIHHHIAVNHRILLGEL